MSERRQASVEIVAISCMILFQELALIRWIPLQVRVIAYFPNVVLMSAFLGLGLGCLLTRRRLSVWLWPGALALLVTAVTAMSRIAFTQESTSEHLWLLYGDLVNPPVVADIRLPIAICFVLSGLTFIPLGHFLATRIAVMTRLGRTLSGYSWDLLGSLVGTVAFATFSYFMTEPVVWFSVFIAIGVVLFTARQARQALVLLGMGLLIVAAVSATTRSEIFSPYYGISTLHGEAMGGHWVLTNGSYHQYAAPILADPATLAPVDRYIKDAYRIPYSLLEHPPGAVLVLGAGTGNDVATALQAGATSVDAVEIDPAILRLGRELHVRSPYDDPRVTVINDDARSWLERTDRRYDLVVFGTLDSMTRLSALSSVRLDNFVYTRECLEQVRQVLSPRGGVVMYFMVAADHIEQRLARLHVDVFQDTPVRHKQHFLLFNLVLMSGPAFDHVPRARPAREFVDAWKDSIAPATDDWPFLYLSGRGFSDFYIQMIAIVALIAALSVFGVSREMRVDALRGRIDVEMMALGAAFLLLETKSVTEMSLVWGSTWLTSAVVFAAILVALLAATLFVDRYPLPPSACIAILAVTLMGSYWAPVHFLLGKPWIVKLLLSIAVIGTPIFFASMLFAVRFKSRVLTGVALGWNLFGAVLGGLLEFTSMILGIRTLALVALVLYLASALAGSRWSERPLAPEVAEA